MVSLRTVTGVGKVSVCQPVVDSSVKVPVASTVPSAAHRVPVWLPVLLTPL